MLISLKEKKQQRNPKKKSLLTHHYNYPNLQTRKLSRNNIRIKKKKDHRRSSDRKRF